MDIKQSLKNIQFDYKKEFGQNFIFDNNLLESIADDAMVDNGSNVLEIGAGGGTLTSILAPRAKKVISFEIDKKLTEHLNNIQSHFDNLEIRWGDFLQADIPDVLRCLSNKVKVVANLPYYITTPIIFALLDHIEDIESITIMVQKEVAERVVAGDGDMTILSLSIQAVADVSICRIVPRTAFVPAPKVDSAILQIVPHNNRHNIKDIRQYKNIIRQAFTMKRKTLVNNMLASGRSREYIENILNKCNLPTTIRAEKLTINDWVNFIDALESK